MIRVIVTASSNLPGVFLNPGRNQRDQLRAQQNPEQADSSRQSQSEPMATRFASTRASSRGFVDRYCVNIGTKAAESAPSANRSRVRFGIVKPIRNASKTALAPNIAASTISRTSPVIAAGGNGNGNNRRPNVHTLGLGSFSFGLRLQIDSLTLAVQLEKVGYRHDARVVIL